MKRIWLRLGRPVLILGVTVLILMAGGCGPKATVAGYREVLDQYQGRHIDELVADWGAPSGSHVYADGRKEYRFVRQYRQSYSAPIYPVIGLGYHHRHFGIGGTYGGGRQQVIETSCATRVITDRRGRIQEFFFKGEACRAVEEGAVR